MPNLRVLLLTLALAPSALAQTAPTDGPSMAAAAEDAAAKLVVYLDRTAKTGNQPDFSKAPAADLFGRVFDFKALAVLTAPRPADVPWLVDWVSAANQVDKAMLAFGITPPVDAVADREAIGRNMVAMEDRLVLADAFLVRIMAREAQSMSLFMDQLTPEQRTSIREQGFTGARAGMAGKVYAVLISLAAGLKPENERMVGAAIGDTAGVWTKFILPKDRPQILQQAERAQTAVKDDAAKKSIAAFSAALAAAN
jgi:hypothetical protein